MQSSWRIGSIFNIPLYIDFSWLFIVVIVAILNGFAWREVYPTWQPLLLGGAGLLTALLLFGSVLLHELGHSLVAKTQGIQVNSITLFLFGGIAAIEQEPKTPGRAFQVAIAGPVVSLVLCGGLSILTWNLPTSHPVAFLAADLARINLVLALFNLIPGLPLDGGQVLKAAIWKATGDRLRATRWAARTGEILGWLIILLGFVSVLIPGVAGGNIWLAVIGWFILRNADRYRHITDLQEALLQLNAAHAMGREFRVVEAGMTLRQFADQYLLDTARSPMYFAAADGRYRGLVEVTALHQVERSQWETKTLQNILQPLTAILTVQEQTPLIEVINLMEKHQLSRITVISPAGAVAGVIDRGDIVQVVMQQLKVQIAPAVIQNIKEAGAYPPGFPILAVAKATEELLPHQDP
ncbi:site-2 protease family protein [Leptolyngbya sp. 'hensonii']|uniref:site-2 protease family protein n=1 Tax=Leptolyngbya sp. 'hensonii' TaxID=1922337 RepID=UPI00094F5587|nr:site-2 protease family protein [Leptolyngbya sp. 'hensonii']OLP20020.1 site-2 protease family protein [Leptolyngbya sp. 'hensonii']